MKSALIFVLTITATAKFRGMNEELKWIKEHEKQLTQLIWKSYYDMNITTEQVQNLTKTIIS